MPRSVTADHSGSKYGFMAGMPGTGIGSTSTTRLPRPRMRSSSRNAQAMSVRSTDIGRHEPLLVAGDLVGQPRVARGDGLPGEVAVVHRPGVAGALQAQDVRRVDADAVHPLQPGDGVGRAVHGGALEAVALDLLLAEDGGDHGRQELRPGGSPRLGHVGEEVAQHGLHGRVGDGELRQPLPQPGVVVEPGPARFEVRVDVDDGHGVPLAASVPARVTIATGR